ncbi:HTH-type transcriptional activator CmpR [Fundidesulfovibrio magnetotacticus]|uniref:HTH-type transcriptional activator CmpR n=1 Tax=Fundidesulfovibrio magnetotacticus TaxID=2730080 RepID=A0A6V8LTX6_9BACT|nr:LysR family transcriptional regulator [Fundidesulfovibrio magnetotacticus]GFK93256.1 HTH-type transcriptional activator CmpR [Fundidesulfovibrio magnetotacticus]
MLELRLLKTFLAVVSAGSVRGAAEALHLAPSTVTAQLKGLEDSLGAPLFDRVGRGVLLAEQGRRLLAHARRLVDLEAEARRALSARDDEAGELALRVSESLGAWRLPGVLRRFRERFPQTRLRVDKTSRQGLARDLAHGVTDVALLLGEPFTGPSLAVEVLGREPLTVILPPGSPLDGGVARPEDLAGMPLFLTRYVWSARRLIEEALSRAHVRPEAVVECSSVEIVKRCVASGLGASVCPLFAVRAEAARGELSLAGFSGGPLWASVLLVRHEGRWLSPAAGAFLEAARECFTPARA